MAVSKVRKLEVIGHGECRDKVLAELRKLGAVHISDVKEILPETENEIPPFLETSIAQVESRLAQILHCMEFGNRFLPKPSFTQALGQAPPEFTRREVDEIITGFNFESFSSQCGTLEKELHENEGQIAKKEVLIEDVSHWLHLKAPFEQIQDTRHIRLSMGICDARSLKSMSDELAEVSPFFDITVIELSRATASIVLMYAKELEEAFAAVLRKYGWRSVHFTGLTGTPLENIDRLREQINELRERNEQIRQHIVQAYLPVRDKLFVLYDHYSLELRTLKVQKNFLFTSQTFAINGWVLQSEEKRLLNRLNQLTQDIDVRCFDPEPGDVVPIMLKNKPAVKPFSLITELYGRPQYCEFDPTPFLAPFFAFFFGICMGDAGYGVVLALGSLFVLKKFRVKGGARLLLQIILWGGVVTILIGILTSSIFAIPSAKLPNVLGHVLLFDPTKQVLLFLYITFLIGLFQIIFGLGLKMTMSIRDGDYVGAISDQFLWMLMLVSLAPLVYKYLFGGAVSERLVSVAGVSALVLVGPLVLGRGRKSKIYFVPLMGALNALRDLLGFFGDTLSYARLMALALSGAFLAMTVNDIASLVLGIPYGIGIVLALLILVFGHMFNIAINALGAFVHSLRLQYLEFFSKFFTGGGKPFEPFAETREYIVIRPDMG